MFENGCSCQGGWMCPKCRDELEYKVILLRKVTDLMVQELENLERHNMNGEQGWNNTSVVDSLDIDVIIEKYKSTPSEG